MFEAHAFSKSHALDAAPTDEITTQADLIALEQTFQPAAQPLSAPHRGFEMPRSFWTIMLGCYAVFFIAIALATGGSGAARFAIVISALYTVAYFGFARIAARQAGPEAPSPLDRGQPLPTWTGPMSKGAVFGQVLIVPLSVALFGLAMLMITVFVA